MQKILNLTQHAATAEQKAAGVVDLQGVQLEELKALLTFNEIPSPEELDERSDMIAHLACANGLGNDEGEDPIFHTAMIGGAPFFMRHLELALEAHRIKPVYAFSRRESVERAGPDGEVVKTNVFRHVGFVDTGMFD